MSFARNMGNNIIKNLSINTVRNFLIMLNKQSATDPFKTASKNSRNNWQIDWKQNC